MKFSFTKQSKEHLRNLDKNKCLKLEHTDVF